MKFQLCAVLAVAFAMSWTTPMFAQGFDADYADRLAAALANGRFVISPTDSHWSQDSDTTTPTPLGPPAGTYLNGETTRDGFGVVRTRWQVDLYANDTRCRGYGDAYDDQTAAEARGSGLVDCMRVRTWSHSPHPHPDSEHLPGWVTITHLYTRVDAGIDLINNPCGAATETTAYFHSTTPVCTSRADMNWGRSTETQQIGNASYTYSAGGSEYEVEAAFGMGQGEGYVMNGVAGVVEGTLSEQAKCVTFTHFSRARMEVWANGGWGGWDVGEVRAWQVGRIESESTLSHNPACVMP